MSDLQSSFERVSAAAAQEYQPQVNAVRSSVSQLQTSVGSLENGGDTVAGLKAVVTDIGAVGTATTALLSQLTARCGT